MIRGPVDDVLGRFVAALAGWTGPYVIRATADNPFVDIDGPARLLRVLDAGADYAIEEGLPVGAAVEAMRVEVLREAGELAVDAPTTASTSRRSSASRSIASPCCSAPAPFELRRPSLRLTVDTRAGSPVRAQPGRPGRRRGARCRSARSSRWPIDTRAGPASHDSGDPSGRVDA